MRVAYLGHSLVADRQARFAHALARELASQDDDLYQLYPESWGSHHDREGGWPVEHEGSNHRYRFPREAWSWLADQDPDVLLIQQEPYAHTTVDALSFAEAHPETKVVLFTWENLHGPAKTGTKNILHACDHIICGNQDAQTLIQEDLNDPPPLSILPQVGIDADLFKPLPDVKTQWDVYAPGRPEDPMKGIALLQAAAKDTNWTVTTNEDLNFIPYDGMPNRYNQARAYACPSRDLAGRPREQFLPAATVEALLCGLPCIVSDQAAIHYWGRARWDTPCPSLFYHEENDPSSLHTTLTDVLTLDPDEAAMLGRAGRHWARRRFGLRAIARGYTDVLRSVHEA